MNFATISAAAVASNVWQNTTRTLTGMGGGPLTFPSVTYTSIAATVTVVIQPVPTAGVIYEVCGKSGAATALSVILSDNSNNITIANIAAGGQAGQMVVVSNTCFLKIFNGDNTNAAFYMLAGFSLKQ